MWVFKVALENEKYIYIFFFFYFSFYRDRRCDFNQVQEFHSFQPHVQNGYSKSMGPLFDLELFFFKNIFYFSKIYFSQIQFNSQINVGNTAFNSHSHKCGVMSAKQHFSGTRDSSVNSHGMITELCNV